MVDKEFDSEVFTDKDSLISKSKTDEGLDKENESEMSKKSVDSKTILSSLSFLNLSKNNKKNLRLFFERTAKTDSEKLQGDELLEEIVDSFKHQKILQNAVAYHQKRVLEIDSVLFNYLNPEEKKAQENELLLSYYVLYKQFEIEYTKNQLKSAKSKHLLKSLERIVFLTQRLTVSEIKDSNEKKHSQLTTDCEYLVARPIVSQLALVMNEDISTWQRLSNKFDDAIDPVSNKVIQNIDFLNWERIAWIFGNCTLSAIVDYIYQPESSKNKNAHEILKEPINTSGILSFGFYGVRLLYNIRSLYKHYYIPSLSIGKWEIIKEDPLNALNPQELKVRRKLHDLNKNQGLTPEEQYNPDFESKKYVLVNDLVWGIGNLACYAWLNYKVNAQKFGLTFGFWGDLITMLLLCMDITITLKKYIDEKEKYQEEMLFYNLEIEKLEDKISDIENLEDKISDIENLNPQQDPDKDANIDNLIVLNYEDLETLNSQLQNLITAKAKRQRERELKFQEIGVQILYALGLLSGFTLMVFLLASPVGAFTCFGFTFFYMLSTDVLSIKAAEKEYGELENSLQEKLSELQALSNIDIDKKNALILEVYHLKQNIKAQEEIILANQIKAGIGMLVNLVVPAFVLLFVLFPPVSAPLALTLGILVWASAYTVPAAWKYFSSKHVEKLSYSIDETSESEKIHYIQNFKLDKEFQELEDLNKIKEQSNLLGWMKKIPGNVMDLTTTDVSDSPQSLIAPT